MFYDVAWTSNVAMHLWTDASDWGYGACMGNNWTFRQFNASQRTHSIAWRELYAVVIAAATWASRLQGKRIIFYCDNMTVCDVMKSGTSRVDDIMGLVRVLFYIAAGNRFEFTAEHLRGVTNDRADAL